MTNKFKTLHDLGKDLLQVYAELREGKIEPSLADSLANVAGKIINTTKVVLEYNAIKKDIDKIEMLEDGKGVKMLKKSELDGDAGNYKNAQPQTA